MQLGQFNTHLGQFTLSLHLQTFLLSTLSPLSVINTQLGQFNRQLGQFTLSLHLQTFLLSTLSPLSVINTQLGQFTTQLGQFITNLGWQPSDTVLHSLREPSELLQ